MDAFTGSWNQTTSSGGRFSLGGHDSSSLPSRRRSVEEILLSGSVFDVHGSMWSHTGS
jgi:hypothetical protein